MDSHLCRNLISPQQAERLIAAHDGDVALLCLFRALYPSADLEQAANALCRTLNEMQQAEEKLNRMGQAAPSPAATAPAPVNTVPERAEGSELMQQYKSEDVVRRSREDQVFCSILNEARKVMGKNLSSVDMKGLFAVYDYLGLPSDVLMLLINHCGRVYEEKYHGQRRPTVRAIQKEADLWARQEIMTMEQAEDYMRRQEERRGRLAAAKESLGIRGRELTSTEHSYINSWLDMGFDEESLSEAYDRTVTNTGALRWNYMNRILLSWHEKNLHRIGEILEKDGRHRPGQPSRQSGRDVDLSGLDELINKI